MTFSVLYVLGEKGHGSEVCHHLMGAEVARELTVGGYRMTTGAKLAVVVWIWYVQYEFKEM